MKTELRRHTLSQVSQQVLMKIPSLKTIYIFTVDDLVSVS